MSIDTINDEIRATRRMLAERFNNDLSAIIADIRNREKTDGRTHVTRPPRPIRREWDEQIDAPKPDLHGFPNG
jgi:hypothetical protein